MSVEQNKLAEHRLVDEVLNRGEMGVFDELIAPEWRERTEQGMDRDKLRELVVAWRTGMPDLHCWIDLMVGEGDVVAVRATLEGTHTGDYLGLAPTGKKVSSSLNYFDRFEEGLVVESWTESGAKGFHEQISGAPYREKTPVPGAAG
ncbi:MAG TPA: ester cyclase [Candidatus Dormibacteraeota bacterium]|jgi:predicted ester cyclase|nr:ester cyclase [Candidatus Dormibacteraeota bacterium]